MTLSCISLCASLYGDKSSEAIFNVSLSEQGDISRLRMIALRCLNGMKLRVNILRHYNETATSIRN